MASIVGSKDKYVVIILSLKKRWLKRHPSSARLRLRILSIGSFNKIVENQSPQPALGRRYKRWVQEEGKRTCTTRQQSWAIAIKWKAELEAQHRKVDLKDEPGNQVYIMEMRPSVWGVQTFANFDGQPNKGSATACCYVGMTSQSDPRVRYDQHRSDGHRANSKWGRQFFKAPFEKAYRRDLLAEYENAGYRWKNLLTSEAYFAEEHLTRWLQRRNIAAYFK